MHPSVTALVLTDQMDGWMDGRVALSCLETNGLDLAYE